MTENSVAKEIVDVAYRIHTVLGPWLFESVYEAVLASGAARVISRKDAKSAKKSLI
jgi:hypothetical protein